MNWQDNTPMCYVHIMFSHAHFDERSVHYSLSFMVHINVLLYVLSGRHQNLQVEMTRLNEREAATQTENQRLQQKLLQLEKVSCVKSEKMTS